MVRSSAGWTFFSIKCHNRLRNIEQRLRCRTKEDSRLDIAAAKKYLTYKHDLHYLLGGVRNTSFITSLSHVGRRSINKEYYLGILRCLEEATEKYEYWSMNKWNLDYKFWEKCHRPLLICDFLANHMTISTPSLLYPSVLTPVNFMFMLRVEISSERSPISNNRSDHKKHRFANSVLPYKLILE